MGLVNLILIVSGIGLMALGYRRARPPWSRYQALRDEDRNVSRYEAWRGGTRTAAGAGDGPSGASIAMAILKRQAQVGAAIVAIGFVLVLVGFFVGFNGG